MYDYAHTDTVVYFDNTDRSTIYPPTWYRNLDVLVPAAASVDTLQAGIKEMMRDYGMEHSVHLISRLP